MRRRATELWLGWCSILLLFGGEARSDEYQHSTGEKLFALHVKSIFESKCNSCHGDDPDDVQSGFDMLSREGLLRGGDTFGEEAVVPGMAGKSVLYRAVARIEADYAMPPKEAEQLTEQEVWWIRDWIDQGAPWPNDDQIELIQEEFADGVTVKTSGGLSREWNRRRYETKHLWAYQPLQVEEVQKDVHPIDWFVNRVLQQKDIDVAPLAEPDILARRLSFGITGLPPDPADVDRFRVQFAEDPATAVSDFAGQLMDSPAYGEHFGRQWLDVVRYADSAGFANDYSRPNAWRYRDYVVRAFNNDKPYNDFVREQIAGDEIDASDREKRIATGFLRMGPWEQTGMSVFRVTRQQWLDDVTDTVGQAFLGHAMQCAKCHDHKFDPIPTRDYYRMMAVFSTTQFAEPDVAFLESENQSGFDGANAWTTAKIAAYQQQRKQLNAKIAERKKTETADAKIGDNGLDPGDEASLGRISKNIKRHAWELDKTRPVALAVHTGNTVTRNNVGSRIRPPKEPWSVGTMEEDSILNGGDAFSRGDPVHPGALSVAETLGGMQVRRFPDGRGKRRLALADWIVDKSNPLTARVIVNRVWSWHFGRGIAANPNNLGATGGLPTHPALLDYLADWFVQNKWSVKSLNRLILTSETYRRGTRHPHQETVWEKDPKAQYYASFRPRRLTAEEIRDAMLVVSGEWNPQVGGIPCRPDINKEVAMQPRQIMGGTASVYEPDALPKQRNRRSLYAEKLRGLRDPFLEIFNQPGPDKSCELRETSTVAPQALTLLNSQEVYDRALAWAARLRNDNPQATDLAIIDQAFRSALGRPASRTERQTCRAHWEVATDEEASKEYMPMAIKTRVKRTVMAEKTGEPYDFYEVLPTYDDYVPDLQPHQTDAKTRGLAHLCIVIFNLNEFVYLD